MTPINFAYWLQGYFELSQGNYSDQIPLPVSDLIKRHLEMCKVTPGDYNSHLVGFLRWMDGALEFNATRGIIVDKLNHIFQHVIDPMTVDQEVSQNQSQAHNSGSFGIRC